jgi:HEPN domain-containing protein
MRVACFVSQQVAEKAVKAFLFSMGEEIVTGHSVQVLCSWAESYDPAFGELKALEFVAGKVEATPSGPPAWPR